MVGYKPFSVMYGGILFYPESDLTLEHSMVDSKEQFWADVYRIGPHRDKWLIYYGENILGFTYVHFTHSEERAFGIATDWLKNHDIP